LTSTTPARRPTSPPTVVTFLFDGSGVNVGRTYADPALGGDGTAASELYWRDANNDQTISVDEARNFAAPNRANFVLHLEGTIVPEPATMSLLGLGSLGFLARRRRALSGQSLI
jgi:hypothetical protein